jgi:hypothetical protein
MAGISKRRQQQAQEFARKLATGFALCDPKSLIEYCNTRCSRMPAAAIAVFTTFDA